MDEHDSTVGHSGSSPQWLAQLRARTQDAVSRKDHQELLSLTDELRRDTVMWSEIWAPLLAISARTLGLPHARTLLDEAIASGFAQPELHEPELSAAFGADPDWQRALKTMQGNIPPPPVTIDSWPTRQYGPPLDLNRLTRNRETELLQYIPGPLADAWDTATKLLSFVSDAWSHANAHVDHKDAVEILQRVADGERFACVEYTTVLSQALNAVGIPARNLGLHMANAHYGVGRGHSVTEAWIDGFNKWVLLDGQNGIYWQTTDSIPLGSSELSDQYSTGAPRPAAVCLASEIVSNDDVAAWWQYFHQVHLQNQSWQQPYVTTFERIATHSSAILLNDRALAYPDLSQWSVGVVPVPGAAAQPALMFESNHPFAIGFDIRHEDAAWRIDLDQSWPLPVSQRGRHVVTIATRTRYGSLAPKQLTYQVN